MRKTQRKAARKAPKKATEPNPRKSLMLRATLAEIARALSISERTLYRQREAAAIEPLVEGSGPRGPRAAVYDLVAVARTLVGRPEDSRSARDSAQAEWLRLRIEKERRELCSSADVQRAGRGLVHAATARLLRLGPDLVRLGVIPLKKESEVDAVVHEALESLAGLKSIGEAA